MIQILLPTDFSTAALRAARYALSIKWPPYTRFIVYHTYTPFQSAFYSQRQREEEGKEYEKKLLHKLENVRKTLQKLFPRKYLEIYLDHGAEPGHITRFATKSKISLIVMGTTGATGLAEKTVGTVTSGVIQNSKIPVLAVPEKYRTKALEDILFTTNFSIHDANCFRWLKNWPLKRTTRIHFLHVSTRKEDVKRDELLMDDFKRLILDGPVNAKNLHFKSLLGMDLEERILSVGHKLKIDLMVMCRGKRDNFFQRLFHSSLTSQISFHTKVPLLVIPAGIGAS